MASLRERIAEICYIGDVNGMVHARFKADQILALLPALSPAQGDGMRDTLVERLDNIERYFASPDAPHVSQNAIRIACQEARAALASHPETKCS